MLGFMVLIMLCEFLKIYFEINESEICLTRVCISVVRFFPEVSKALKNKKKKPRSTYIISFTNITTLGLKWTLYILACIKTVKQGPVEKGIRGYKSTEAERG